MEEKVTFLLVMFFHLSAQKEKSYKWLLCLMLWSICFLNYADRQIIFSIFPLLSKEFGFSKLQLGLIGSSFMWIYAGGSFIAGFLADRYPKKSLIFGGCFFWSVVTMLTGCCSSLWQFVVVRTLEGVGEVFYFPASTGLLAAYHDHKTRSTAFAIHQSGVYGGMIVGGWLGAWMAEHYGWRYGFYFFGGIGVFIALFLYRFLKTPEGEAKRDHNGEHPVERRVVDPSLKPSISSFLAYVLQDPIILLLILAYFSANFVTGVFFSWMPTFLYEKFSMSLSHAGGSAVITIQMASIVGVLVTGRLGDHFSFRIRGARILIQMVSLFLGGGAIIAVGMASSLPLVLGAMVCYGFCKGGYDGGIFASQFDYVEERYRGSIVGLMNTFGGTGGALGTFVIGLASSQGVGSAMSRMSRAISWSATIYLLGASFLLAAFILSRKKISSLLAS